MTMIITVLLGFFIAFIWNMLISFGIGGASLLSKINGRSIQYTGTIIQKSTVFQLSIVISSMMIAASLIY